MTGSVARIRVCAIALCVLTVIGGLSLGRPAAAQDEPHVLRVAVPEDIADFNLWSLGSNSIWKARMIGWSLEGLMGIDYDLQPYPLLAESYTFVLGTLTYTFNIRHGVMFNDGLGEMTAADVVFMYKAARQGTTMSSVLVSAFDADLDGLVSQAEIDAAVTMVDAYTVQMKLARPYGQFLTNTATLYIQPSRIWANHLWGGPDPDNGGLINSLWGTDPAATVGTGPFRYLEGVQNDHRTIEKFSGYWGTSMYTPLGFHLYPSDVDQVFFKVYSSFGANANSAAAQDLESGIIDLIPWAIPSIYIPGLEADPHVQMSYLPDNGYFYLAFNEKVEPMGDISFRRAVSHLIDKDQIVNSYLGGYGSKGSACLPPFWGNWFNESVAPYPYSHATATQLLDQAGFLDIDFDGWREAPGGSEMGRITILTPPSDYDTVRPLVGSMIANNMRSVGLDAETIETSFDTLVARLQSMDYEMLIIGWSLTVDPVANVFDILGPLSPLNTFGFWSDVNPNPYYADLGGVVTTADSYTQASADMVLQLGNLARASFDSGTQNLYTEWAQGEIADAVPVNVLYYRVNAAANGPIWIGWMPYLGNLLNLFSLAELQFMGSTGIMPLDGQVNFALTFQDKVALGRNMTATVLAVDALGIPIEGANVDVSVSGMSGAPTVVAGPSGHTDSGGLYSFEMMGISIGFSSVTVEVSVDGVPQSQVAQGLVQVVAARPPTLVLNATVGSRVLTPGETTAIQFTVVDENSQPVPGATVHVDPSLISYGSVNATSVISDQAGACSMTYYAPTAISQQNSHLNVALGFGVTKPGYSWTGTASVPILIYNTSPSEWSLLGVVSVSSSPALSSSSNSTVVVLQAVNASGSPLANETLDVVYSNEEVVFDPARTLVTNGIGNALLTIQVKSGAPTTAFTVSVQNRSIVNSAATSITFTYVGGAPPAQAMYAGYITYDTLSGEPFMGAMGMLTATAHIWNHTGEAADGVPAGIVVSASPYGTLATSDLIFWDSTWDGWGINIVTRADESNILTTGPMNTEFDYDNWLAYGWMGDYYLMWDWGTMSGSQISNGVLDIPIYGIDVAPADIISGIYVVPDSMGIFNGSSLSYEITGSTVISSDCVFERAHQIAVTDISIEKPILTARESDYDASDVKIWVTDQDGQPLNGADATVFQQFLSVARSKDYGVIPYETTLWRPMSTPTDASGFANETLVAIGEGYSVSSIGLKPLVYARGTAFGYYSLFAQSCVFIYPQQCFLTLSPVATIVDVGEEVAITASVTDTAGAPLQNMTVSVEAHAGTIEYPETSTDAAGIAAFVLNTTGLSNFTAGIISILARTSAVGYEPAMAATMVVVIGTQPSDTEDPVAVAGPDMSITLGDEAVFNGSGSHDNVGITKWTWTLYDPGIVVLDGILANYTFQNGGVYVVNLTVEDASGNKAYDTVTVTVNSYPLANAGPNLEVDKGEVVQFNGSESVDPAGGELNYTWSFTDSASIVTLYGATPAYVFTRSGTFAIELTVREPGGLVDTDEMLVMVANHDPTASAGTNLSVSAGTTVPLDGTGSSDPDGDVLNYTWTLVYGGEVRLLYGAEPSFTWDEAGTYMITLLVTDTEGATSTDSVTVTVTAKSEPTNYLWAVVGVGIVVVAFVGVLLFLRLRKR